MTPRARLAFSLGTVIPLLIIIGFDVQTQLKYRDYCPFQPDDCERAFYVVSAWVIGPRILLVGLLAAAAYVGWGRILLAFAVLESLGILLLWIIPRDTPGRLAAQVLIPGPWPYLAASISMALYVARRLHATPHALTHVAGAAGLLMSAIVLGRAATMAFSEPTDVPPWYQDVHDSIQRSIFNDYLFALVMFMTIPLAAWWPVPPPRDEWGAPVSS